MRLTVVVVVIVICGLWIYSNQHRIEDLTSYAPADSLAFVEVDNLEDAVHEITDTNAWRELANSVAAPRRLTPNGWLVRIARWTGIGSVETLLFARSQMALVLSGAQATQTADGLVIKPLATLIIETHTSQRRMRPIIERHIEEIARRIYENPVFMRKENSGLELNEWQTRDATRQLVFAFHDTALIISNDEGSLLRTLESRGGERPSLRDSVAPLRPKTAADATLFGFVNQSGVKSLLQGYALYRGGTSPEAVTSARLFSDTIGGLVSNVVWTSRLLDGTVEDHCSIELVNGVADRIRSGMVPDHGPDLSNLSLIPSDAYSVSFYRFHDAAAVWSDLNAAISSHTDVVGAIATRPMLHSLLKPYGIDDAEAFSRAIGPALQTARLDQDAPAVLIVEVFDRPALQKIMASRLGDNPPIEQLGETKLLLSRSDNRAAAFVDNYFIFGPIDAVRACLQARAQSTSLSSTDAFRKSQRLIDVSLHSSALTFTDDRRQAISFIELFGSGEQSTFATRGPEIDQTLKQLPYAVSVSILNGSKLEWSSRSAFGLFGALLVQFAPQHR